MATDIDFKEIEKAMAELVNKSQSQTRKKQLTRVVRKRDEIAKKVENSREQGRVATKRIIIGNKTLRSSIVGLDKQAAQVPRANPSSIISDFKKPIVKPFIEPEPQAPSPSSVPKVTETELNKTVGDLSDSFLKEDVSGKDIDSPAPEPDLAEPEFAEPDLAEPEIETSPPASNSSSPSLSSPPPPPESPIQDVETEPDLPETLNPELDASQSTTPQPEPEQVDSPIYNPNSGAVHRMYGQRMKTPLVATPAQSQNQNRNLPTLQKHKKKKGFLFYFVLLLTLAALGVWGYVGYIFFVPKS